MKTGILTHYNVSSHGALLQMYALQEELKQRGHEVSILTFQRNMDFIDEDERKRYSASLRNLPYYLKSYMGNGGVPLLNYQYKKQKTLSRFRAEHFKQLPYTESGSLDCVVVGADEVFSLENGVNIMMFGHGVAAPKRIAYAPSFGQTDLARIDRFGCRELIRSGLAGFDALSVRDRGSAETVRELLGIEPLIVCDPALLHDFGGFDKTSDTRYIVVYSYQSNFKDEDRIQAIRQFAKGHHCALWSVGVHYAWCDKKINCDPLRMLNVFAKAQYVITDTFHGTISSYIARTPMAVFVRNNNNVKLDYLLESMGLQARKITALSELEQTLCAPLDFTAVDDRVAESRRTGAQYLDRALGAKE